jgi:hypothetical protein
MRDQPFPTIGILWYQVFHLPDAIVIGHEVGHAVEIDCELTEPLQQCVERVVAPTRRPAWQAWRREVFADLWGGFSAGPAFAGSLMDFLVGSPDAIAGERVVNSDYADYPPRTLRILINLALLAESGYEDEAEELRPLGFRFEQHAGPLVTEIRKIPLGASHNGNDKPMQDVLLSVQPMERRKANGGTIDQQHAAHEL